MLYCSFVGEIVPGLGSTYNPSVTRVHRKRAEAADETLPFLRAGACQSATLELKNLNLYVTIVTDMPGEKKSWNNFPTVLYTFYVYYCVAEGLVKTSELARAVLLYLFHGKCQYVDRKKRLRERPVLHGIHFKVWNGRSRFLHDVQNHFSTMIELVQKQKLQHLLTDMGLNKAPLNYLAAVEEGIRSYGSNKYAMGSRAMVSRVRWMGVEPWRKREAYIAAVRFILKKPAYKQWTCFRWEDHKDRNTLAQTFKARHEYLSNSLQPEFGQYLEDPPEWDLTGSKQTKKKRTVKRKKARAPSRATVNEPSATITQPLQRFDKTTGCLVPHSS